MENSSTETMIGKRLTVGIDVGDRYSRICVLDAEGEVAEAGFLMTEEAAFRSRFTGMAPCLTAMEASTHSPWLSRLPRCDADQFARKVKDCIPEALGGPIEPLLRIIAGLTEEIDALDKRVKALAEKYSQATVPLMQVDSIGPLIATTYALTVRDP